MPVCEHCLLDFPEQDIVHDEIKGKDHVFCCSGCMGIYRLIHNEGLDSFYERRRWDEHGLSRSVFGKGIDTEPFAEYVHNGEQGKEIDLYIDGIRCASCVWLNEKILQRTGGIVSARVNYASHRAHIVWNPEKTDLDHILRRVLSIGYIPKPYSETEQVQRRKGETRDLLIRFGTAAFLSSQLMIYSIALYAGYFQGIDEGTRTALQVIAMVLTIPVLFYSGLPFFRNTLSGLRHLRFNMDSLISVGAGSAFTYSIYEMFAGGEVYFDTAAMIVTLILLGRYLESVAKGKAAETVERLTELLPTDAVRLMPGSNVDERRVERVPISMLSVEDLVEIRPGERVPVDGVVIDGRSEVDEAALTGESRPVQKEEGAEVIGGTMNLFGALVVKITRTGKDTVLSGIIRAVEEAQVAKPRIQALADRVVGMFVPAIIAIALVTIVFHLSRQVSIHEALMIGVSVLVIACPCSLGLATPLAIMVYTSVASSKGLLIRSGDIVEQTGRITHVVFDKTGTITTGTPEVREVGIMDLDGSRDDVLVRAAAVESRSEHSIARAVLSLKAKAPPVADFKAIPGKGVEGQVEGERVVVGNRGHMAFNGMVFPNAANIDGRFLRYEESGDTVVFVGWGGRVHGFLAISDPVRKEAQHVVQVLEKEGIKTAILSGDNQATTRSIAERVGIGAVKAEASPVMKKDWIGSLQQKGANVVMVGDGINDAPSLTQATVGIAMGRGTEIAMESSDTVLMRNDLSLIPFFIRHSRKTLSIIRQNIFWAFLYNVIAIPLAVAGVLHPIFAAGAMAGSSLFVVMNSLRIKSN